MSLVHNCSYGRNQSLPAEGECCLRLAPSTLCLTGYRPVSQADIFGRVLTPQSLPTGGRRNASSVGAFGGFFSSPIHPISPFPHLYFLNLRSAFCPSFRFPKIFWQMR